MENYLIIICLLCCSVSSSSYWMIICNASNIEKQLQEKEKEISELKSEVEWHANQLEQIPTSCPPYGNIYGVSTIKIPNWNTVQLFCNTVGWIVIQRRLGGHIDFNGTWSDYRDGFGYLTDEFFIGLETIYRITKNEPHELYISLSDCKNEIAYAKYDNFAIGGEETGYMLKSLGTYSGTAGNSMSSNLGKKFTTQDRDNDNWLGYNCASLMNGGWWYSNCGTSNLNGPYTNEYGVLWHSWRGWETINYVEMLIRRKSVHF